MYKTKAAIFDLDGTLIDSMWIWEKIDHDYLTSKGLAVPSNLKDEINHLSFKQTAYYFKNRFQLTESIEEILKTWNDIAYYHYSNNISLKEGAKELLDYLKSKNIKIALATSNSENLLTAALKYTNIYEYFDIITTTNEVDKNKSFPDVYLLTADKLGVSPNSCIVFEDILEAVRGAKLANMKVCAVYDKSAEYQRKELSLIADKYINNFRDMSVIKKLL